MFDYFVPVVKFFMLSARYLSLYSYPCVFTEFPGSISFMVLDFMFQLVDILQLDIDLVVIMFNLRDAAG